MLCDEYLVVLVGATHIATSFNLVLILLGECFTRAYHAGSFEIAALCGKNAVVHVALDGAFMSGELRCVGDADVMNGLACLDFGRDEFVDVFALPFFQCCALTMLTKDFPIVFISSRCNIKEFTLVTVFLVRASVADLGCALEALLAINVLHVFAKLIAVAIGAPAARGAFAWTILAYA